MSSIHWLLSCVWAFGCLFMSAVHAECRINDPFGAATHYLVNGRWHTPSPEITFKVPGSGVGNGIPVIPDSISFAGNNRTLANHVRFRLAVKKKSATGARMYMDSSTPLSCTNCASTVSIPFSTISWTEGNATETKGNTPGDGQFADGVQSLIYGAQKSDNIFNLQFNFANSQVLPAGIYEGEFLTRGIPQ